MSKNLGIFSIQLEDENHQTRWMSAKLLSRFFKNSDEIIPFLSARLRIETDDKVILQLLRSIGHLLQYGNDISSIGIQDAVNSVNEVLKRDTVILKCEAIHAKIKLSVRQRNSDNKLLSELLECVSKLTDDTVEKTGFLAYLAQTINDYDVDKQTRLRWITEILNIIKSPHVAKDFVLSILSAFGLSRGVEPLRTELTYEEYQLASAILKCDPFWRNETETMSNRFVISMNRKALEKQLEHARIVEIK